MEGAPNERESALRRKRLEVLSAAKCDRSFPDEIFDEYPELRGDREVITAVCQFSPIYIEIASDELKQDEDFIIGLARSINFKKFPNLGMGGKHYLVFLQDAGYKMADITRIEKLLKDSAAK